MKNITLDRAALRKTLRQKRQQLTQQEQHDAANTLLQTFLQSTSHSPTFTQLSDKKQLTVALYLANDGEISPSGLCEHFWTQKSHQTIHTYLPVIKGESLVFADYHTNSTWQKNAFGIDEPIDSHPIQGSSLDLVFLPLVGFDKTGARLGMGGGFYDRTFAGKQAHQAPILIGLAHDCQQVDQLPIESWDVPLDAIMTGTQLFHIS